jgi:hypothetical protein
MKRVRSTNITSCWNRLEEAVPADVNRGFFSRQRKVKDYRRSMKKVAYSFRGISLCYHTYDVDLHQI